MFTGFKGQKMLPTLYLPSTNRARNRLTQELARPSQTEAIAAMKQEMKIVPRRANTLFIGSVNQQPKIAQQRYAAHIISTYFAVLPHFMLAIIGMKRKAEGEGGTRHIRAPTTRPVRLSTIPLEKRSVVIFSSLR